MSVKPLFLSSISAIVLTSVVFYFLRQPQVETKVIDLKQDIQNAQSTIIPKPTRITSSGHPSRYHIKTAFVPQAPEKNWDQPWQDTCEEAALLTAVYFYQGRKPSLTDIKQDLLAMVDYETSHGWGYDVNLTQMAQMAKDLYGFDSQIIDQPTLDELKTHLSSDRPVVVPANGKTLHKENRHFRSGGPWYHNLTIIGYDDDRHQFIVHDVGTQHGADFHYSYSLLMESIHDFPSSGRKQDINQGPAKVLVLLK